MKCKEKPLVTIIIPVFNAERFLAEVLDSCLHQTYTTLEIICVNNNSNDSSNLILSKYVSDYPKKIRLYQEMKAGAPAARNKGMQKAKGDFLFFLDSDDALFPRAIEQLVGNMEEGIDAVCGGENYYHEELNGEPIYQRLRIKNKDFQVSDILYNHPITSAVLIRVNITKNVKWNIDLKSAQELIFFTELCLRNNAKFKYISELVCKIRIHKSPTRISNQGKKVLALNRYNAILKIESMLNHSTFRNREAEIALNDYILKNAFMAINAKNFKVSKQLSRRLDKTLIKESVLFKKFSKEWITFYTNHYIGFFYNYIGHRVLKLLSPQ